MTEREPIQAGDASASAPGSWIYVAILLVAFVIRFSGLGTISSLKGDEAMHVASAGNYMERGYFGPDNWYHPPLKHILLYGSMRMFGDNPYGWRLLHVLFGSATVVMLFMLSRLLYDSTVVASISSGLLLFDPLHIIGSRTTFEEVPAVFFLIAGLYFAFLAFRSGRERDRIFSGILIGLSAATKWYCLPVLMIMLLTASVRAYQKEGASGLVRPVAYFAVLPFLVYLLSFIPWFLKGYSPWEWALMQSDAFREIRYLSVSEFHPILAELGGPVKWFTQSIAVGFNLTATEGSGAYVVIMNNPPVWIFVLPSITYLLYTGMSERSSHNVIIGLSFWALYLAFLLANRPVFLYTVLSILPFGFIAIGYAADRLLKRRAYLFLVVAAVWSMLLYPLVVGISVPIDLYQPLLGWFKIYKPL